MKKILLLLLITSLCSVFAQNKVTSFNHSNSALPDNDLQCVTIDKSGKLWVGTAKGGVAIFEDNKFKIFNGANSIITGNYIGPVFCDHEGNIWLSVSDPDKLFKYDGKEWKEIINEHLKGFGLVTIKDDQSGIVYLGGKGLLKFDGNTWSKVELPQDIIIRAIDINPQGLLALGHNDGLIVGKEGSWKFYKEEDSELQLGTVRAVKFNGDELFIGYGGGFGGGGFSILKGNEWKHFNKNNSSISDHMVRDIEIDSKGNYWMSTNNGLIKFKDGKVEPIFFREGMYKNVIMDVVIQNNIVWIATTFGLIKLE